MEAVNKQDIIKGDPFGEIQKEIAEALGQLYKFDQGLKDTAKSFEGLSKNSRKTVQDIDAITKAEIESEKLLKQKVITQQTETKLLIEQEKLKQAAIRTAKAENSIKEKTLTLYQQESRKLNDLRNAYKNLAVQNKENTKEAKALLAQITPLDAKLKAIDKTVGQGQRTVGLYGTALDNLKGKFGSLIGLASQFGLALGGVALVSKGVKVLKDFDEGAADIAKTTGLTVEETKKLSQELLKIDTKTAVNELQGLAAAAGSLNIEGESNIIGFVDAADKAFVALGDDLGGTAQEIATNVGKIAGVFGDEKKFGIGSAINKIGSAINELAGKSKAAAAPILDFTQRMAGLGNLISSADTAALGAFFDEGGQSVEVASSTLNTLLPKMAQNYKEFAKTAGMSAEEFKKLAEESPIEALKAVANGAKNSEKGLFNLSKTVESFGVDSARATSIVGFLANNTDRLTELQKVSNDAFRDGTSLTDEFNKKNETLGANFDKVVKSFDAWIISADSATGATGGFSSALGFIADNMSTIINLTLELIAAYVVYKATVKALNLADQYKNWKNLGKGIQDAGTDIASSSDKAKGFGNALKGIGFTVAIAALFEIGAAFYDIASGAEAARDAAARLDKQLAKSSKDAAARVSERTNSASTQIAELQRLRNENKITEKEFLAQKKAITEATKDEVKTDIQKVNARKAQYLEEQKALELRIKTLALDGGIISNAAIRDLGFELNQVKANIQGSNVRLKEYYAELLAVGEVTKDLNSELVIEEQGLKSTTKSTREKAKAVEDLTNKVEDSFLTLEQMHEMEMKRLEEEKRIMQEINELNRELNNDMANDNTIVDVIPEEFSDMELLGIGIISDSMKEKFNAFEEFQKGLTNILTEQIDARIAQLKKEEDAAKSTQDYLQELAASGNINAQQSITQAIEFQRESQAEQARLERTKQQIQLISSGLSTFNKEIADGKKPGEALVSTGFVMQTLIGLLKNVQFFAKGTDNAPEGLAVVDEKGAEIITDKKGKIKEIGTGKGARFTHLSKGDKVFTANQTANILDQFGNIQNGQTIDRRFDVAGNSYDLMMISELKNINQNIKNSGSSSHTDWGGIFNGVGEIVERKMKNGNIVTNRYRMKS